MNDIRDLEPKALWNFFYEITQIPHPSNKEEKLVKYLEEFGRKNGLETIVDKAGNVLIRKPATPGMEQKKGLILQTHLDMVPQKNGDKQHDFENDPIETIIDGEWVRANGTTLGSDNGIGVAAAMAFLAAKDLVHGPLEALFTVGEETGMKGVVGMEKGLLRNEILLNLDSEDEGELYVGCAGGINVNATKTYGEEPSPKGMVAYGISAKGLKGGHSGVDIALGRANSNKLLFRFLMQAESDFGIRLVEASGGDLRNAIPRESKAVLLVPESKTAEFESFVNRYDKMYQAEFAETEPNLQFTCEKTAIPPKVMNRADQYAIIRAVFACPNGVQRMSQTMKGLVETSNNLGIVRCKEGNFEARNLTRSSVDSAKKATAWRIAAVFHLINADVKLEGGYPGWNPNMNSPILKALSAVYCDLYGKTPQIKAIHAGLECALIGGAYPNLDMISLGPTIRFPHSPDEKVNIDSTKRFWNFLVAALKHVPVK